MDIVKISEFNFNVALKKYNFLLFNSIKKCIPGSYANNKILIVDATTVEPFNLKSSYNMKNIIKSLVEQIRFLRMNGMGIIGFDITDITVIDDSIFLITNSNLIFPIKDENLVILTPFNKKQFISPEVKNIVNLPAHIYQTNIEYSIALFVMYIFDISKIEELSGTEWYNFLTCCMDEPKLRFFL